MARVQSGKFQSVTVAAATMGICTHNVTISPPFLLLRYDTWLILDVRAVDSYMLTIYSNASWRPSPFLYDYLLSTDASLCTCILCLWPCCLDLYVYKRPTGRLRNSKRVLFCTNTSCRWTCPFLILWTPILGNYPTSTYLSLEQLSYSCDLAIRVMTTRNIRTRFPKTRTPWTPISPPAKVVKPKKNTL